MRRGPRCSIAQMLDQLNEEDLTAVRTALSGATSASDLSVVLRANGYRIMPQTIRRHRGDHCSCSAPESQDVTAAGTISGALALLRKEGAR